MEVMIDGRRYTIRSLRVDGDPNPLSGLPEVRLEECQQESGPPLWAIRRLADVLGANGWEWEPQPSSRDEEFLKRCRYPTPEAAVLAYWGRQGENHGQAT